MKKLMIILTAVIVLVMSVYPLSAFAENRSVMSLNVSCAKGEVSYSGTVASGVKAAAVLLFDPDGNLMMMDTCEVKSSGAFSGEMGISLTSAGVYTVKASDYEGGSFTEKTFSQYSITYHLNGGKNNAANPSVYSSTESVSLLAPTRSGYGFSGWYTESSFATKVTGWSAGETGDKNLYAKWRKISYDTDPEPTVTPLPTATLAPATSPTQTPALIQGSVIKVDENGVKTSIDQGIVRAVVDDSALQQAIDQILQGIRTGQIKPGKAVIELPKVELPPDTTLGSIEFDTELAQIMAEYGISVRTQIDNAIIDIPAAVLAQAARVTGSSSVRIVSGREENLDGADNGLFRLSAGEQGQLIGSPYSFALELLMADGSVQNLTDFDEMVSITIKLTEEELAAIENPDNLKMVYVNPQTGETEVLKSVFDREAGTLTFYTTHFSVFQLMEIGEAVFDKPIDLWWLLWVMLGIAIVGALVITYFAVRKRRLNNE
jgi:uncharacterized repeat protein (TIGR02543 family)